MDISEKQPYISAKEPYISAKESDIESDGSAAAEERRMKRRCVVLLHCCCSRVRGFSKSLHSRPGLDGSWCSLTYLLRPPPFCLPALPCAPKPTIGFKGGTPCSSSRGSPWVYHNGSLPPEVRSGLADCALAPARDKGRRAGGRAGDGRLSWR